MKTVVLKDSNKIKRKVFTNKKDRNTIKKNYNPLSKDCNIYERGGLYMEEKRVILKEVKKNINWKLKVFVDICPNIAIMLYRKGVADCFKYYNKDGTF